MCLSCTLGTGLFAQSGRDGTATPQTGVRGLDPFDIGGTDVSKPGRLGPCGPQSAGDCPGDITIGTKRTSPPLTLGRPLDNTNDRKATVTGCVAVSSLGEYSFTEDRPKDRGYVELYSTAWTLRFYQLVAVDTLDLKAFVGKHVTIAGSIGKGANALVRTLTPTTIKQTPGECK